MSNPMKVVIVGGVAAGPKAAARIIRLKRLDFILHFRMDGEFISGDISSCLYGIISPDHDLWSKRKARRLGFR